jgi:hypothetical protein
MGGPRGTCPSCFQNQNCPRVLGEVIKQDCG